MAAPVGVYWCQLVLLERNVEATVKRMVCLANSRKWNERCIAGRELQNEESPGSWVRPVSAREHEGVSLSEQRLGDGGEPRLMDVIDVPVLEARPKLYQSENWLLDPERRWERVRRISPEELERLADPIAPLWRSGFNSTNGLNDRIPNSLAESEKSSLRFIRVDSLTLSLFRPGGASGDNRRRIQGKFRYAGNDYSLRVTDPAYERRYQTRVTGTYRIGETYLTISLGEPFEGYVYKLIAAVIETAEIRSTR